jgi:hypothetical protein
VHQPVWTPQNPDSEKILREQQERVRKFKADHPVHESARPTEQERDEDYEFAQARVVHALEKLVSQLDAVHADPTYQGVWTVAQLHIGPYTGPQYSTALSYAKKALAARAKVQATNYGTPTDEYAVLDTGGVSEDAVDVAARAGQAETERESGVWCKRHDVPMGHLGCECAPCPRCKPAAEPCNRCLGHPRSDMACVPCVLPKGHDKHESAATEPQEPKGGECAIHGPYPPIPGVFITGAWKGCPKCFPDAEPQEPGEGE